MTKETVKVYQVEGLEVHQIGNYVSVVWNTKPVRKEIASADGLVYAASVPTRQGKPYIAFLWLWEHEGQMYRDDDCPICGGISATEAVSIAQQLAEAVEYLKTLTE